jgi:protein TonB
LSATRTPSEAGAVSGDAGATKPRSFDAERGPETSRQAKNTNVDVDIAALRERLEQRVDSAYPVRARKAGVEGTVVVTFAVGGTGGARDLAVAMSSGSQLLDEAALRLVRESGPYPHIPVTLRLPIRFRLRR